MLSVIQHTVIAEMRKTRSIPLMLAAVLCGGLSVETWAQVQANEINKDGDKAAAVQAETKKDASKLGQFIPPLPISIALQEELEEVVVVARRIEGDGGRRRHNARPRRGGA